MALCKWHTRLLVSDAVPTVSWGNWFKYFTDKMYVASPRNCSELKSLIMRWIVSTRWVALSFRSVPKMQKYYETMLAQLTLWWTEGWRVLRIVWTNLRSARMWCGLKQSQYKDTKTLFKYFKDKNERHGRDFRLPLWCRWALCSSRMLHDVG